MLPLPGTLFLFYPLSLQKVKKLTNSGKFSLFTRFPSVQWIPHYDERSESWLLVYPDVQPVPRNR
jgi:hypothetical protein